MTWASWPVVSTAPGRAQRTVASAAGASLFYLFLDVDVAFGYLALSIVTSGSGILGYLTAMEGTKRAAGIDKKDKFMPKLPT